MGTVGGEAEAVCDIARTMGNSLASSTLFGGTSGVVGVVGREARGEAGPVRIVARALGVYGLVGGGIREAGGEAGAVVIAAGAVRVVIRTIGE